MTDLPDLAPPWSRIPLVNDETNLFPEPTVGAMATEITARVVDSPELKESIGERRSPVDPLADTVRTRYISYQKQEPENNFDGGEVLWFDTAPLAKSMLTWRLPMENWTTRKVLGAHDGPFPDSAWQRVVWAGGHWLAQDQPDDNNPTVIHGHWSVETPVPSGQLHTRFQIFFNDRNDPTKVGSEVALISTNRADFLVDRQTTGGESGGRFILAGSHALDRAVEFSRNDDKLTSRRWIAGVNGQTESSGNVGANFVIRRYADNGDLLGHSLYIRRATGEVTVGSDNWTPPPHPAALYVAYSEDRSGVSVQPSNAITGAAFRARLTTDSQTALSVHVGVGEARLIVGSNGKLAWGSGSAAPDTTLYRDAFNRLKTDGELVVVSNVRTGSATGAGGVANVAVGNGTPPTSTSASQFNLVGQGGIPWFVTNKGTVKLDPQPAIADATDGADAATKLNSLLGALRTIGLIAS